MRQYNEALSKIESYNAINYWSAVEEHNTTDWSINVVAAQKELKEKSKTATKKQMEDLLNEFLIGVIKSHMIGESSIGVITEIIGNWNPSPLVTMKKFSDERSNLQKILKDNKKNGYNCYKEYTDCYDNINKNGQKYFRERLRMIPLPIKLYMSVFGMFSISFLVLFAFQLLFDILWNPVYTFLCLISSIGLFLTASNALKDWKKTRR